MGESEQPKSECLPEAAEATRDNDDKGSPPRPPPHNKSRWSTPAHNALIFFPHP